jgi:small-conductance mechanosensitive channel
VTRLLLRATRIVHLRLGQPFFSLPARAVGVAVFWFVLLIAFLLAADLLEFTLATRGLESLLGYLPNLLAAVVTVTLAYIGGRFLARLLGSFSTRMRLPYGRALGRVIQYAIVFVALVIATDQIGIEIAFLIDIIDILLAALLFTAALAFGLGARASIGNILAIFYARRTYREGDEIQIGELVGTIKRFDATAVILDTERGQCSIPGKEFGERHSLLIKRN